jgi:putative oxidoreductase
MIMEKTPRAAPEALPAGRVSKTRTRDWERAGILYARIALVAAFLSAIASRFGLYGGKTCSEAFANFVRYTAEVNSFLPAFTIPFLAWGATLAEGTLGIALIAGLWPRQVALGSALLLAVFGTAMAVSFGIKSPLDYSVFSASAAAALLGLLQSRSRTGS